MKCAWDWLRANRSDSKILSTTAKSRSGSRRSSKDTHYSRPSSKCSADCSVAGDCAAGRRHPDGGESGDSPAAVRAGLHARHLQPARIVRAGRRLMLVATAVRVCFSDIDRELRYRDRRCPGRTRSAGRGAGSASTEVSGLSDLSTILSVGAVCSLDLWSGATPRTAISSLGWTNRRRVSLCSDGFVPAR